MNVIDSSYDFSAMHERMQFYIDRIFFPVARRRSSKART